jgi:hypothetical protein
MDSAGIQDKLGLSRLLLGLPEFSMVAPLTVACSHCGAKLKLKSAAAVGKKVACPKCQKPFVVKAPEKEDDDMFGDLPMDDFGGGEEESEEEQEEAPVRRKGGSSKTAAPAKGKKKRGKSSSSDMGAMMMTVLFVLLGVGALGGAGYAVYSFLPGGGGGIAAYLPEATDVVVYIRPGDLLQSPIVSPLMNEPTVKAQTDKMSQEFGFTLTDIESVTLGGINAMDRVSNSGAMGAPTLPTAANDKFVGVIRTKTPVDLEALNNKLPTKGTTVAHNGVSYLSFTRDGATFGAYRAEEKLVVIGSEAELKSAIDSKGAAPAKARFKFVDTSQQFVIAMAPKDPAALKRVMDYQSFRKVGNTQVNTSENLVNGVSIGVRLTGDVTLVVDEQFISSSSAKGSAEGRKTELSQSVAQLEAQKAQFGMMAMMMPALPKLMDQATTSLKNAKVAASGSRLRTEVTFPGSMVADIKSLASTAMAMQGMGGGFPEMPAGSATPDFSANAPMPPGGYTGAGPGGYPTPMGSSTPMPPGGYNPTGSGPPGGYSAPMGPGGNTPMPGNSTTPMAPGGGPPGGYSTPMGPTPMPGATPMGPVGAPPGGYTAPMGPTPMPGNTPMGPAGAPPGGYSAPMGPTPMGGPGPGARPMSKTPMKPK